MTDREPSKASESIQQSLANRETVAPSGLEDSTPTGSGPFSALPSQFGRYRVTKLLGRGAMGTVYLAHDPDLGKEVALKVPKFSGDEDPVLLERFRREARAAGDLNHANICGVYEVGQIGTTHFIAMEYIDGRPLSDYISPDLPSRKIAILVRRLALALAQAHDRGIVHRDLKPANIMVNLQGEPVIMDFGLARRLDAAADVRATQSGMIVGSPAYMSPEQARGENDKIGPWTDIYGLGTLFFELLTGSLPFRGPMLSVLGQLATQPPPKPSSLRTDVDPRLESLCLKMLEKKPQNRPASMAEVARSLTEWLKPATTKSTPTISLVEEPVALVPTKPAAPRAEKVDGIEAHKQRVTDLLDKHQYGPALELLEKITNLRDAKFEKLVAWAKPKLKEVRAIEQKLKEASTPSCDTARQLLKHYDFVGVIQVLEQVPPAYRSIELRDLLEEVTNIRDECDHLQRDIEEAVRTRDTEILPALVKRLYKLRPNNKAIKQLAADLKEYGAAKVIARRKGQRRFLDPAGRIVEPSQIVLAVLAILLIFFAVYLTVENYRKSGKPGHMKSSGSVTPKPPHRVRIKNRAVSSGEQWLAGGPASGATVRLVNDPATSGATWEIVRLTSGNHRLQCVLPGTDALWLDGDTVNVKVLLSSDLSLTGTNWERVELPRGVNRFRNLGHVEGPRWLAINPVSRTIILQNDATPQANSLWEVIPVGDEKGAGANRTVSIVLPPNEKVQAQLNPKNGPGAVAPPAGGSGVKAAGPTPPITNRAGITLQPLPALSLKAGEKRIIKVVVTRENADGEIRLQLQGLPSIVTCNAKPIPRGASEVDLELIAGVGDTDVSVQVQLIASMGSVSATQSFSLTVAKRPDVELIFEDDFKDPNKKRVLEVRDSENEHKGYENGLYVLALRRGPQRFVGVTVPESVRDFEFETKVRFIGMAEPNHVSIGFRDDAQPKKMRTLFWDIYFKNTRLIRQIIDLEKPEAGWKDEIQWEGSHAGFINPGPPAAWNVLKIRAHGGTVELTTNDKLMSRVVVGGPNYKPETRQIVVNLVSERAGSCSLEFDYIRLKRINK